VNIEPQNEEFRMPKENQYFDIRNSLFDNRQGTPCSWATCAIFIQKTFGIKSDGNPLF